MPVRNGMPFLPLTLASIAAQSHQDHQILVRDNGSDDGTGEELRRWIPSRIPGTIIRGEPRTIGASCAELVDLARTDYCARIDADDVNHPSRLAAQLEFMEQHPEVASVGTAVRPIDANGQAHDGHGWDLSNPPDDNAIVHLLLTRAGQRHPSMLFRRTAMLEIGNYPSHQATEDYVVQLRLAARHRLANLETVLLDYRFHAGSVSQNLTGEAAARARVVRAGVVSEAGAAIFGVPRAIFHALKLRELRFALPHVIAIARALELRSPMGLARRLRTRSFQKNIAPMIAHNDRLSRLALAAMRRVAAGG